MLLGADYAVIAQQLRGVVLQGESVENVAVLSSKFAALHA